VAHTCVRVRRREGTVHVGQRAVPRKKRARHQAAHAFYNLLVLASDERVELLQPEAYGPISVSRGAAFNSDHPLVPGVAATIPEEPEREAEVEGVEEKEEEEEEGDDDDDDDDDDEAAMDEEEDDEEDEEDEEEDEARRAAEEGDDDAFA
jgi:hypothetical protein